MLIICKIMVTIQQWRAAIGQFAGGRKFAPSDVNGNTPTTDTRSPYGVDTIILLQCIYTIFTIYFLLLCSGNVELNPGPTGFKKCPKCLDETVPIKLKTCPCGYIFHTKSHRQPPKCHSGIIVNSQPVTSHVEGVTDGDPISIVQSQPVTNKGSVTSHKWEKYKSKLNKNRMEKYRFNPSPIKEQVR